MYILYMYILYIFIYIYIYYICIYYIYILYMYILYIYIGQVKSKINSKNVKNIKRLVINDSLITYTVTL